MKLKNNRMLDRIKFFFLTLILFLLSFLLIILSILFVLKIKQSRSSQVGEINKYFNKVSNFGTIREFECTGYCYCENPLDERRVVSPILTSPRSIIVVSAVSSILAYKISSKLFHEKVCENNIQFSKDCPLPFNLKSNIDDCSDNESGRMNDGPDAYVKPEAVHSIEELEREDDIDSEEKEEIIINGIKFECSGHCLQGEKYLKGKQQLGKYTKEECEGIGGNSIPIEIPDDKTPFGDHHIKEAKRRFELQYLQEECAFYVRERAINAWMDGADVGDDNVWSIDFEDLACVASIDNENNSIKCNKI